VKAYDWSETDKEYILEMEYVNKPDYFKEKIDENLRPVKNETKMMSYMEDILNGLDYLHKS